MDKTELNKIVNRLDELSNAVTKGKPDMDREFYMSIPARPNHDADLVLSRASQLLKGQETELQSLREENEKLKHSVQGKEWKDDLPPVGTKCEIKGCRTGTPSIGVIDYIDDIHCIWHWVDDGIVSKTIHNRIKGMEFRPIQSTAERKRNEFINGAINATADGQCDTTFTGAIYDWLIENDMLKDDR